MKNLLTTEMTCSIPIELFYSWVFFSSTISSLDYEKKIQGDNT